MPEQDGFLARWSRRKVQAQQGVPSPELAPDLAPAFPPELAPDLAAGPAPGPAHELAPPVDAALAAPQTADARTQPVDAPPAAPTLAEAQRLTTADDFSRFVGRNVDPQVKNTALRTLFSDPHFNVMDGLDTYIDDYGKPDPLPPGMLRQLVQSSALGLFDDEPEAAAAAKPGALPPGCAVAEDADNPALAPHEGARAAAPGGAPEALPPKLPPTPPTTLPVTPTDEDTALRLQPHDAAGPAGDCAGTGQDPGRQH